MGIDGATVLALGLAVLAGSVVQSSVGFGLAVVAAPFVIVLAPDLMPGALILAVVALSLRTIDLRATRGSAVVAGGVSGVTGTAAAIGGPFMAMVLQHEAPTRLRSTLAVFFTAGSILGLGALAVGCGPAAPVGPGVQHRRRGGRHRASDRPRVTRD